MEPVKLLIGVACAWALANVSKIVTTSIRTKSIDWQVIFFAGGMPSVHAAVVVSLLTSLLLTEGVTTLTVVTGVFTFLFVYDAMTLRRAVADHNLILRWIHTHLKVKVAAALKRKGGIGHTPLEVVIGIVIGIVVPLVLYA